MTENILTNEPKMDFPCKDDRIQRVKNQSRELKALTIELRSMLNVKMDALFGAIPPDTCGVDVASALPENWIDEVLTEISIASTVCRENLERLSSV